MSLVCCRASQTGGAAPQLRRASWALGATPRCFAKRVDGWCRLSPTTAACPTAAARPLIPLLAPSPLPGLGTCPPRHQPLKQFGIGSRGMQTY